METRSPESQLIEFVPFAKIARLSRAMIVTEKIDGTNACVAVNAEQDTVRAGSRNRWITPEDDNHGFARWVRDHEDELRGLGHGLHFGEWWGSGIQRGYGLEKGEKRFSLFNVSRWSDAYPRNYEKYPVERPACCHVVPTLAYSSSFDTAHIDRTLERLRETGSQASPGFMRPEGVVVLHTASGALFKKTLEKDAEHKHATNTD